MIKTQTLDMDSVSQQLVEHFRREGKSLREIGEWLGVGESFISRVARGERNLTLAHLAKLEKVLGKPMSLILFELRRDSVPARHREMYTEALRILTESDKLIRRLKRRP